MLERKYVLGLLLGLVCVFLPSNHVQAGAFGEAAISVGGSYPQGTFTRYADPGFMANFRATIHAPEVEFFAFWLDFSFVSFSSETIETQSVTEIPGGPTIIRPVDQRTSEDMYAGHIGLQIANPTRKGFFRPRAALGIGLYQFRNVITWTETIDDTTSIVLADEVLDSQTSFGWRGLLGADFFVTPQIGITADFIYDHVFELNQDEGPDLNADLTSRFQGFTVGIVYMFEGK